MTHVGEGHEVPPDDAGATPRPASTPGPVSRPSPDDAATSISEDARVTVLPVRQSEVGDLLAGRYRLEEHVNDDSAGRQVWRGTDVILRRPVAVVLRHPGGESAAEMMSAAVAASRVVHPHIVGVYDAVDEGDRAYVVREWVDGRSLREVAAAGPLDVFRATALTHAVVDALAAVHATGTAHGNVHAGTVMIDRDGRVVLADARATHGSSEEADVRAAGAVLYFALTGRWPHEAAAPATLPDAVRLGDGRLAAPRQVRPGVPAYLDGLCRNLLDPAVPAPPAAELADTLARHDVAGLDSLLGSDEPPAYPAAPPAAAPPRRTGPVKGVVAVAGLVAMLLIGTLVAMNAFSGGTATPPPARTPQAAPPSAGSSAPVGQQVALKLGPGQIRIVEPAGADRDSELTGAAAMVDGDPNTGWLPHWYLDNPVFGGVKKGVGIFLDLGATRNVTDVEVQFNQPGATVELRKVPSDPGSSGAGDAQVIAQSTQITSPIVATSHVLLRGENGMRYLLLWISRLPSIGDGKYQVGVQEITVHVVS